MDAIDFLRGLERITEGCTGKSCNNCDLDKFVDSLGLSNCVEAITKFPEATIDFEEKWGKEHPTKTYKDVFLEKFPKAPLNKDGSPKFCIDSAFNLNNGCLKFCGACWNQPYKEDNNEKEA